MDKKTQTSMDQDISRRTVLKWSGATMLLAATSGCAPSDDQTIGSRDTTNVVTFEQAKSQLQSGRDAKEVAAELVGQMTLSEKLSMLEGDLPFWPGLIDITQGGYQKHPWPASALARLGIPGLQFADGPRGCVIGESTTFPVMMARGATFDPDLEQSVAETIAIEQRAMGANFSASCCMNLLRHPAWGRAQETYSEDPYHMGTMAVAHVAGQQKHVMACAKHFALNSMENMRFKVNVTADERTLHEVYLPHFHMVADAGVASFMSAYNSVNGEWCGENKTLLTDILRDEWQWDGIVITDFILGLRDPVQSVTAGCNIEMPFQQQRTLALPDAVQQGILPEAVVDQRVIEIVGTFLRFSRVFDHQPDRSVVASAAHRTLARDCATSSMVLLKNDGLLPVNPETAKKIAVLGSLANVANLGDGGSSNIALTPDPVSVLQGVRARFEQAEVVHSDDDASVAQDADLVLVVVGYTKEDEGEYLGTGLGETLLPLMPPLDHPQLGLPDPAARQKAAAILSGGFASNTGGDRSSLRLTPADEALIRAAKSINDKVVVIIQAGSAVVMPWLDQVSAALMMWYAGSEGGTAFADVLTGTEPGGRLPFAIPKKAEHLVPFDRDASAVTYDLLHGQWYLDHNQTQAHLPFGFGLSYTQFEIEPTSRNGETVTVIVSNTGERTGSTVVQVYGGVPESEFLRPPRRLVGFKKVTISAGDTETVNIPLDLSVLRVRKDGGWLTEDKAILLSVGLNAAELQPLS